MKRTVILTLILLLLILMTSGCDLRNRQDSADFIPTGTYTYHHSENQAQQNTDQNNSQEKNSVKTVLSYSGEIPVTTPVRYYSYELPMIDLPGAHAAGCNQDIENYFGTLIRQSMDALKEYRDPVLEHLSYSSFTISGILTLRIDRRDYDGQESQAWYTVDAKTGNEVTMEQLFSTAGISDEPKTVLKEAVTNLFQQRFGTIDPSTTDSRYYTAQFRTTEAIYSLSVNRMHLNENGNLTVAIELFSPDGGSTVEELTLP